MQAQLARVRGRSLYVERFCPPAPKRGRPFPPLPSVGEVGNIKTATISFLLYSLSVNISYSKLVLSMRAVGKHKTYYIVILAKARIHRIVNIVWIPAFGTMTM